MRMRVLIWCDTYYQLLSAVHMSNTLFQGQSVSLVLSDHSAGAEEVADRLRQTGAFDEVVFAKTKDVVYGKGKARKIREIVSAGLGKASNFGSSAYDEVVFYGLNPWLYGIGDESVRCGKTVYWSRYDEGVLSYGTDFSMGSLDRMVEPLRRLFGKYRITEEASRYYCYFPELKQGARWDVRRIPPLDGSCVGTIEILKKAFAFEGFPYEQRFIFFASSSDIDGRPFGETESVFHVADIVGSENLLVKMHPRDSRDVYRSRGIAVMENSQIPWEVVQLCAGLEGRSLLTITSGAFLSVSAMTGSEVRAAFLMPSSMETTWLVERMETIGKTVGALHHLGYAENVECVQPDRVAEYLLEGGRAESFRSMGGADYAQV